MENPRNNNSRSSEFRYIYANGIAASFTGNEAVLVFGLKENPADPPSGMREEVGVIMVPLVMKTLAVTLTKIVEDFESKAGQVLPVEPAVLSALDKAIKAAKGVNPFPTVSPPPS
jgi:hypothetical protein